MSTRLFASTPARNLADAHTHASTPNFFGAFHVRPTHACPARQFPLLDPSFCERLVAHGHAFTRFADEEGVSDLVGVERPLMLDTMKLG